VRNYFNYFTEVEEYFVRKRGKNVWVAPLDWCLIELWKENGIPLNVVLRGIDRSFEAAQKRQKKSPSTLFYCHPAVMEVFEEYQNALVGSSEEAGADSSEKDMLPNDEIRAHLELLVAALDRPDDEHFARVKTRVGELRQEVEARRQLAPEELDRQLTELECFLAEGLQERMNPEDRQAAKDEVSAETRIYRRHLNKEMYERLCRSHLRRKILAGEGIPEFTILRT
jgi:hypothetical protein